MSYPKHIKRQLRKLADQAHERELAQALSQLAANFDAWRAGEINAFELNHLIHKHHQGPARKLYGIYNDLEPDLLVGRAVVMGLLPEDAISEEIWPYIQNAVDFSRQRLGDSDERAQ
jgi:hypothetical protein